MELRHETVLSSIQPSPAPLPNLARELKKRIRTRTAKTGIIGLGYVGLPLAVEMAKAGFQVTGIDLSQEKVNALNRGVSYIPDVPSIDPVSLSGPAAWLGCADSGGCGESRSIDARTIAHPRGRGTGGASRRLRRHRWRGSRDQFLPSGRAGQRHPTVHGRSTHRG